MLPPLPALLAEMVRRPSVDPMGRADLPPDMLPWYNPSPEGTAMTATDADEPLIRRTPDVVGGQACIGRSRIAVFMLVEDKQLGSTDARILANYPGLTQQDLDAAWAYYAANRQEIEDAIRRNNSDEDE